MHDSWKDKFKPLRHLALTAMNKVNADKTAGKIIYPSTGQIFNAFNVDYDSVKVVIIGQDPYHGANQANGLAFAVNDGTAMPPSLLNIFKELKSDLGHKQPLHGHLLPWRDQGVLLLNTSLTVEANTPASHKDIGWMPFVKGIIKMLDRDKENLVFILWGKHAQGFKNEINSSKHCIITSAHPSPLSADYGFFGSRPFSRTNAYLNSHGKQIINWGY